MKTLTFDPSELEALRLVCASPNMWPGMGNVADIDLASITDTGGIRGKDTLRDHLESAVLAHLNSLIGGCNWSHPLFAGLRSACFKLRGEDVTAPLLQRIRQHKSPPTGTLVALWVLDTEELDCVFESGLDHIIQQAKESNP